MPYKQVWVDNDLFLEHKGIKVYHVHREDDDNEGLRFYMYGLTPDASDSSAHGEDLVFDARLLPTWRDTFAARLDLVEIAVVEAIDRGIIKDPAKHPEQDFK